MPVPTSKTLERITQVARMRVDGASWRVIATKYGYKNEASACTMMTQEYPKLWKAEYEAARAVRLNELEIEAVQTQRELIRPYRTKQVISEEGKLTEKTVAIENPLPIRQSAAHSLLNHTRQLRAQKVEISGPNGGPMEMSLEDRINTLTDRVRKRLAGSGSAGSDSGNEPVSPGDSNGAAEDIPGE